MSANISARSSGHDAGSRPTSVKASEKAYKSEMMFIGERCHLSDCHRDSFLPIRCPDCHHQFCSDHYKTADHHCAHASATFVVPLCPLCHEPPKNWKRDEDPNIAMNAHLSPQAVTGKIECVAVDERGVVRDDAKGRQKREKRDKECNERKCRKLMIVPIQCPSCSLYFCPSHRAPGQHNCDSIQAKAPLSSNSSPSNFNLKTRLSGFVSQPSTAPPSQLSNNSSSQKDPETRLNPLQAIGAAHKGLKTDKRARSEHESALKALQARHAKGLLTPAEEVRLAEEMALSQQRGAKQDCIVL